ncbi:hypothetical protein GVAV_001814 [Gurleya vavrai]
MKKDEEKNISKEFEEENIKESDEKNIKEDSSKEEKNNIIEEITDDEKAEKDDSLDSIEILNTEVFEDKESSHMIEVLKSSSDGENVDFEDWEKESDKSSDK